MCIFLYESVLIFNFLFYCVCRISNRPVTAALYKKGVSKSRQWRSLESSVIVLRLRKCDNIGNFHRNKVRTPSKCETRSAIIEFLSILNQKQ